MESTDDYIFVGNMKTGTFRYSPAWWKNSVSRDCHPKCRGSVGEKNPSRRSERVLASNQEIADGRAESHCIQYRARNRNDEWIWLQCRGYMIRDIWGNRIYSQHDYEYQGRKTGKKNGNGRIWKTGLSLPRRRAGGVFTVRVDTGFTLVYGNDIFTRS